MPNLLSALLPHSPLLIDEIGKDNKKALNKTIDAYQLVYNLIKEREIEIIITISQHGLLLDDSFSIGTSLQYNINFEEFACFKKRESLNSALKLSDNILKEIKYDFPLQLIAKTKLDHGSAIPLELLTKNQKQIKVLPLFPANDLDWLSHYNFGQKLGEIINNQSEKIAIIASGDLSHRLKISSPGGFSPKGVKFDKKIIEYLNDPKQVKDKLLKLDKKNVLEAKECVLKPLLILLGIIGPNYQGKKLAYQDDFGIGYLSFLFK